MFVKSNALRGAMLATTAIAGAAGIAIPRETQAQALQPAVDVCTGITLPRSAITEVIGAVNQPIVDQIETTVNGITTVTLILDPLAVIPDLNIDLSSILDDAEQGDPISLQVVDTEGNVLGASDDCNIQVDGVTLDEEAGLAIGGNQISGLGADGEAASAGELDAIALGNNASTAVGANGAIAIGTDASATAANSVALGAGSIADRGAVAGYTAPGLTGTFDSAGSVSVGVPGAERQITNVAPGTAPSDAATVGQVQGALDAVTALDDSAVQYDDGTQATVTLEGADGTTVTNVAAGNVSDGSTDAVNGSQLFDTNEAVAENAADIDVLEDTAVQYDDATQSTVTFGGADGTTLTNVADGELSADSSDAVNGSQLFETNQQVAENTADIVDLDGRVTQNETDIADLDTRVDNQQVTIDNFDNRITQNETDIDNIDARVTVNEGDIAQNATDIENIDARVTVNEGDIAQNTTDIANIDGRVTVNEGDISNLDVRVTDNSTSITVLQEQVANVPVGYVSDADGTTPSDAPTDTVALISASGGAATLTNVAEGTLADGSTDAVNGSQLFATNQQVGQNTQDIETINNNLEGSTVVAVQYSDPDDPTRSNGGTITNDVTLVGADPDAPVALHNVADGTLANDAVTLGQLQTGLEAVMTDSMAYTDMRFAELAFDLEDVREDSFAGAAAAMAVAGIPQTIDPGRSMVGGAVGHYRGETAFAIGASTAFDDGRGVVKAGATVDTRGNGGVSAGVGFSF